MRAHRLPFATWALVLSLLFTVCVAAPAEQKNAAAKPKAKKPKKPPAPPIGRQLTQQDFDAVIRREYWFVEFYLPTCPHCKKFAPTWKEFTEGQIKNTPRLHFAQVNCMEQGDLCANLEVQGYPELNFFYDGKKIGQFNEDRFVDQMTTFIKATMKENDKKVLGPPPAAAAAPAAPAVPPVPPAPVAPAAPVEPAKPAPVVAPVIEVPKQVVAAVKDTTGPVQNPDGKVLSLDLSNFQSTLAEGPVFIKFFAPWCGHCKKLAPVWEDIANHMKGKLTIAQIDCEAQKALCQAQNIEGYPQLFFYSSGKKVEYIGKRAFEQISAYANKAILPAAIPIALPAFEEALKTQDVFFLLDYPPAAGQFARTVEEAAKVLVGSPAVYHSTDSRITSKYGQAEPPVLMVFKDGQLYNKLSLEAGSSIDKISDWLLENRLPLALELSPENFAHVMKSPANPLVVLAAVDPKSNKFSSQQQTIIHTARRWRDKRAEWDAKHGSHLREVVFVWMDAVQWASWLKSMYGVKSLPKIVIVDHAKLVYTETDASGRAIEMEAIDIIEAVNDALRGVTKWKHSENIAERGVRYLNDSVESGYQRVQQNWTMSFVFLGAFFVVVYAAFRRCLRADQRSGSLYTHHHGHSRLD